VWISSDSHSTPMALRDSAPSRTSLFWGDREAMRAALNWYRAYDFTTMGLPDITVPTLFVWSPEDVAIAREGAELTGRHVDAPYLF